MRARSDGLRRLRPEDGSRYLSGTEYEFDDALRAHRECQKPEILVYRRGQRVALEAGDPLLSERILQWERLEQFFQRFSAPDGSLMGGVNAYRGSIRSGRYELKSYH